MSRFFSKKYDNLIPYVPGEQPQERKYIKLNTNESPFAPSKFAIKLAKAQLKKLNLYSDPDQKVLTSVLAKKYGVKESQVILTNGSDEVLNFCFMAYCDEKTPAIFPDITYGFYKVFADLNRIDYEEIPLKDDLSLDVNDYMDKKGTIFIANPNAPTGKAVALSDIEKLVNHNKDRIVVIDEAYVDFGGESAVKLVDKYDNLIVTQTFSKSRQMAGARLGFGIANEAIISDLNAIKFSTNPYNVNRMTALSGVGAILDEQYFSKCCQKIIENRLWTKENLEQLGFNVLDSKTNFLFITHPKISGENLYTALKEQGILVRHFKNERIKDYNRVTIGDKKQMKIFIEKIKQIMEDK